MMLLTHGEEVYGVNLDPQTRCAHYHSEVDIIAIKFQCCDRWFPCHECHRAIAGHEAQVWPVAERNKTAVLCGECGRRLSITEYLGCDSVCPGCAAKFNPACAGHHHLYFARETRD